MYTTTCKKNLHEKYTITCKTLKKEASSSYPEEIKLDNEGSHED